MRFLTTTALALMLGTPLMAQDQVACTIGGCERVNIEVPDFVDADNFTVQEVWKVVNDVLSVSGLAPNFQVVETEEVGNAAAVIIEEQRLLAFNPVWMNSYRNKPNSKWQLYAVMAHEVGHHLQGHTLLPGGSRPPTELEADEYAGFTLGALGATLEQSQSLFRTLSVQGSATHPPQHQRLAAVERGWMRQRGSAAPSTPVVQNPAPAPAPAPAPRQTARAPQVAGETCAFYRTSLGRAEVCASTVLDQQKNNTYGIGNLFDGDTSTAWVEGAAGNGLGQQISVSFENTVNISDIILVNGYAKSDKSFYDNARIRTMNIRSSTNLTGGLDLEDTSEVQSFGVTGLENVDWVTFAIGDVYPGARWEDTALSEIRFR